jgi:thiamine kinase-like enzyme
VEAAAVGRLGPDAQAVERLWPGGRAVVVPLTGGITNRNFRVDVDGQTYVLRLPGQDTELLGIDRGAEHAAGLRAAEVGVGPEVIRYVEPEAWLVTRFIAGSPIPVEEVSRPGMIDRVAAALRRFHQAAPILGHFDAHAVVDQYARLAQSRGARMPGEFDAARTLSQRIREARGPQAEVPCHNDLLNANLILANLRDDGEVKIIDWEYAAMGDRFFDLANLSVNHEFTVEHDGRFLDAYFGAARPADLAALRLMRIMSDFREAMWGVVQGTISNLDFDFAGYAATHFARLREAGAEPAFESYLDLCAAGRTIT